MYISHKYKIIFVRIPKTACSSITDFLIRNIKDSDAVHSGVDDSKIAPTIVDDTKQKQVNPLLRSTSNKYVHYTLEDIINEGLIKATSLNRYRCIGVIRDPVDRQKSMYYFRKKWNLRTKPSLQDYKNITINNCTMRLSPITGIQQSDFLMYNGVSYGNMWLYENIEKELPALMKDLGLNSDHKLPKHKFGNRKTGEFNFDEEVMDSLKAHYHKDFKLYNELKLGKQHASN
jgi:hypothetical protein